jgi:hypothetical protein
VNQLNDHCQDFFYRNTIACCSVVDKKCLSVALARFLESGRKEDAFDVYFCFAEIFNIFGNGYDKNTKYLLELICDYEMNAGVLVEKQRDHYVHSVYVFAMGLSVYVRSNKYRNLFLTSISGNATAETFLYRWGLAALFHDIGYPFEIVFEQIKSYTKGINTGGEHFPILTYKALEQFISVDGVNINEQLGSEISRRLGIENDVVLTKLNRLIEQSDEYIDHAYFGAVIMYRTLKNHAESEVMNDVTASIMLHNSFLIHKLKADFNRKISPRDYPLAFLLMFCDELQDFGREGFGKVSKNDNLAFTAEFYISDDSFKINYIFDDKGAGKAQERIAAKNRKLSGVYDWQSVFGEVQIGYEVRQNSMPVVQHMSANFFKNIQRIAMQIHSFYLEDKRGEVVVAEWDRLSLEYKLSNIEQAKSYAEKLDRYGYFYDDRNLHYAEVTVFTDKQIETIARNEHKRWLKEKKAMGWTYGIPTDKADREVRRIHSCCTPYNALPENEKEKDKDTIKHLIDNLNQAGFKVYRLK